MTISASRGTSRTALIEKGSPEHERYFRAFVDQSVVEWAEEYLFGNTRVTSAKVFSVEHAGTRTRFVLYPV